MRQWEIYDFPIPEGLVHPCVILSPDVICQNPAYDGVNVLMCVSVRGGRDAKPREVRLEQADGLDGPTVVKCHLILFQLKDTAGIRRGEVVHMRRNAIQQTINACLFQPVRPTRR